MVQVEGVAYAKALKLKRPGTSKDLRPVPPAIFSISADGNSILPASQV